MTARELADRVRDHIGASPEKRLSGMSPYTALALLEERAARDDARALLIEVIRACAPPVEALATVHADGKWIAPTTVAGLRQAQAALRMAAAALAEESAR